MVRRSGDAGHMRDSRSDAVASRDRAQERVRTLTVVTGVAAVLASGVIAADLAARHGLATSPSVPTAAPSGDDDDHATAVVPAVAPAPQAGGGGSATTSGGS